MPHRLSVPLLAAIVSLFIVGNVRGDELAAPFVAGFDRFVKNEIAPMSVGRKLLLSELNCTACHQSSSPLLAAKRGPDLSAAGSRLQLKWMEDYLQNPQKVKPGATMPDVLAGVPDADKSATAKALAAYLVTQTKAFPQLKATGKIPLTHEFWKFGDAEKGQATYHQIGCVACHEADTEYDAMEHPPSALEKMLKTMDAEDIAELGLADKLRPIRSIPHANLAEKYTAKSLTFFLLDPAKSRPNSRMPNFKLSPIEAANIAAYLQAKPVAKPTPPSDPQLVERGRMLFTKLQCNSCHTASGVKYEAPKAKPLDKLDFEAADNCLKSTVKHGLRYELSSLQTRALATPLKADSENETLELSLLRSNCYACHERNDQGGVAWGRRRYFETIRHIDLGDEGRIPPPLTNVGAKLTTASMAKFLSGSTTVRPHLKARMPVFPKSTTGSLPSLLVRADKGNTATSAELFEKHDAPVEAGRALIDTGCIQCHSLRGESLPGVVGVDLADVTKRVNPQWFKEFLLDPAKLKSRTRMPTFFPAGKSSNPKLLDGDVDRQIASLWNYLHAGSRAKLPEKILAARSKDFELVPTEKPILLRTFMKEAGTHAIAVGFPEKIHYSFDAEKVRLATAWRGRFLDAYGTWFVRFAPPADPLGSEKVDFPKGVPFAQLANEKAAWPSGDREPRYRFLGYEFDGRGVPQFAYRYDDFEFTDQIFPVGQGKLNRLIVVANQSDPEMLWFRVAERAKVLHSKELKNEFALNLKDQSGLNVSVTVEGVTNINLGRATVGDEEREVVIGFQVAKQARIQITYQWEGNHP